MKKLRSFLLIVISLFATTTIVAQSGTITSATATKEKGYTVLNPGELITIYKYQHLSHSPKEAEKYKPKYFFTTGNSDVLQELTKMNLKKAFPANHPFHDALDAQFEDDNGLNAYDSYHKMYKVSWLLKENTK
jgi:hypothetical protein